MFDFLQGIRQAPLVRPGLNLGCLFDIPTGKYMTGRFGESLLSGGLAHATGICGRGNTFKSAIEAFMLERPMDRYPRSAGTFYCTEITAQLPRLQGFLNNYATDSMKGVDLTHCERFRFTDKTEYNGTAWYEMIKTVTESRAKRQKADLSVTPFLDRDGSNIEIINPLMVGIDSLSLFTTEAVDKMQDNNAIGDSGRNMEAMSDGRTKTQMLMELPTLTAKQGLYVLMTAHMGDKHHLDPYAPKTKKLSHMNVNITLKNVPEKFTLLPNNVWWIMGSDVLKNQTTKAPEFPRDASDAMAGDTDLQLLTLTNLRGKGGPSGLPFELIVSQEEGLKIGLSEFYYLKTYDRFGIEGNDRNYQLALCPDINLSRTTIRRKIDESPRLQRALEISSELCQMRNLWHHLPAGFLCTPQELFKDLKDQGYDWDQLLATRGWWTSDNEKHPIPFLSTMDMLNMRAKLYRPYWMKKEV